MADRALASETVVIIGRAGASPPSGPRCLYICIYIYICKYVFMYLCIYLSVVRVPDTVNF